MSATAKPREVAYRFSGHETFPCRYRRLPKAACELANDADRFCIEVSDFGKTVFGLEGYDRFLEDIQTLWLIYWNLSSSGTDPLFAWHYSTPFSDGL